MRVRRWCLFALAAALLLRCAACGARQGRTDRYDGYTVRTEKTAAPAETPETPELTRSTGGTEAAEEDYVLNRSSMRFHYPDCSGVQSMKEANRWNYRGTRQSVLDMGYAPCKICDP